MTNRSDTSTTAPDLEQRVEYPVRDNVVYLMVASPDRTTETRLGELTSAADAHALAAYLTRAWQGRCSLFERAEKAQAEAAHWHSQFDQASVEYGRKALLHDEAEAKLYVAQARIKELMTALQRQRHNTDAFAAETRAVQARIKTLETQFNTAKEAFLNLVADASRWEEHVDADADEHGRARATVDIQATLGDNQLGEFLDTLGIKAKWTETNTEALHRYIEENPAPAAALADTPQPDPRGDWQPIETAPLDQRLRLWLPADSCNAGGEVHGQWDADRYATKPRPFWNWDNFRKSNARARQPTHWAMCSTGPVVSNKAAPEILAESAKISTQDLGAGNAQESEDGGNV